MFYRTPVVGLNKHAIDDGLRLMQTWNLFYPAVYGYYKKTLANNNDDGNEIPTEIMWSLHIWVN